ncbi:hypothetical protein [Nostoc sp.]|uniref:hypothetical protein n=1 Tax=Nostoc sp. TaxID=1180 RepID=UPI002FF948B0
MSQYPIILIPQAIKSVQSALPPKPPSNAIQPEQPGATPKKINNTLIAVETAIAIPVIPVVSQLTSLPGWFLFLVAVGAIAGHVWYQFTSYPQRLQKHHQGVADYTIKIKEYEHQKQLDEEKVKESRSPEKVAEFQSNLLLQVLNRTIPHDGNDSIAIKNPKEKVFKTYLKQYFSNNIHTDLTLAIPNFPYPYTPDFVYIDRGIKLYIDIELDEPYVYHTGKPTHYLEATKDNNRNLFFLDKGWVVIRFSEEQIAKYPKSCIKTIATVISEITKDKSILSQFMNIPDIEPIKQWTLLEAKEMYSQKFRDTY